MITFPNVKAEAKLKYGEDWTNHLAESDHKIALEKRYEQTKDNNFAIYNRKIIQVKPKWRKFPLHYKIISLKAILSV